MAIDAHAPPRGVAPLPLAPEEREPWGTFLRSMFRVGVNTFGGPVAQIGVMHEEAVERRKWLDDDQFVHLLNFANVLPGPEALEIAIHLGYLRRGVAGGVAAGLLFIWPGFVSLTLLGWMYATYGEVAAVGGLLSGIRPVAVALIAFAVLRLADRTLKGWAALGLLVLAFLAHFLLAVPFLVLLLGCGLVGVALGTRRGDPSLAAARVPLVLLLLVSAWVAGYARAPSFDLAEHEPSSMSLPLDREVSAERLGQIAWINTKAALVTFGGAYTVLPYLHEQMVRRTGWLEDGHVVDALALGETTPGPLISFGIFLSYLVAGLPGAVVSGVFLFLPSFVLVLGLGRYIHRVESIGWAPSFLGGVSSGTIGLILSLSAQVAPRTLTGAPDLLIAIVAFVALWRLKANVLLVVALGASIGWLRLAL